ncbi:MAG: PAS domain S-box protein [Acidobacteria bacterium]|nr:PAS domain S-box protein [Acidobacteriota bacterium]
MAIRLKTKFTLTTALLVLGVVAVVSSVYVVTLTRQSVRQANERAKFVAQQVFLQAQHALNDAADQGAAPTSERPEDLREYVRRTLDENAGLTGLIEAALGYSATIYEVTVVDGAGVVMLSSDASLPSRPAPKRTNFEQLVRSGFVEQLRVLYGPQNVYEVTLPFNLSDVPFGEIRIGVSTVFLREEIRRSLESAGLLVLGAVLLSTLLAAAVSHASLRPLEKISAQLDRITQGKFEPTAAPAARRAPERGDELAQVSTKINLIGKQLHDVREIFSTLRENMAQVMAGLEDGLLLFTADGRNVLASPSVEKFLGMKPDALLGRRASEIFPAEHPLRAAGGLRFEGDQLERVEGAEAALNGAAGRRRVGASVQVIEEGGSRMGALVTLRDLDSLERIGSQLEISERLAALGRVTAGVAHEVKNPLNSMRLWIENLKEAVPQEQEVARKGLKILDSEIDRLDRVVRTFLDFNRPVELRLEETSLGELLVEVVALARPQIENARVEATLECADGVPLVRVDRPLLKQALLNLVLNACEAMDDPTASLGTGGAGGGRLTLAVRAIGDRAQVTITDTGGGIPPECRGKIFQLYFTTRPGGSGIGLATTFRIVQMHGGSIDFTSEVGRGTSFTIELPQSRPHSVPARARPAPGGSNRENVHAQP